MNEVIAGALGRAEIHQEHADPAPAHRRMAGGQRSGLAGAPPDAQTDEPGRAILPGRSTDRTIMNEVTPNATLARGATPVSDRNSLR
jgi:hypothetical protein